MTEVEAEKLKLMVVDDEADNLDLLYRTFRRDFQVFKASNAKSALKILDTAGEMAVIISDQRMPEMNGTEFLGLTVERFPDTIRILLTGFTDVEDLVEAINSGQVFKYITKPWKPDQLKVVVSQATETYRLVKQRTQQLSRALRRESLFNEVTTAIRESLDYRSMLQKIVATIGKTFEVSCCILKPVESDRLTLDEFTYQDPIEESSFFDPSCLIEKVLVTRQYQLDEYAHDDESACQIAVPLTYQKHLLAVLALYQHKKDRSWKQEDIQLILGVAEQAALALYQAKLYQHLQEKQEQIHAELEVARRIQNNLLRQTLPDIKGAKVQACCYPAREVGGDFFEVFVHPKGDLWLAVGDVSGKGVPAALFMASAISVLRRELSQETPAMPNVVMQNLNYALADDLINNNCFITIVLARYTPTTRELVYANAGHIYPLLSSPQKDVIENPNYLKVRSIPLGISPVWQAPLGELLLTSGDTLLLASDGITEATVTKKIVGSEHQNCHCMLNLEGLWELLQNEPKPLTLKHLLARVQADNQVQGDDQTILSLEVL
ncbi:SpoIIE family protein phosphatase [Aetokthonos hydrillicola Thurmond2011]|jgi:serine phosphatase RsbU (regulator of sigma subunit)/FixJ family two-component response regulator|uniref:SpoIIE family protein phosphatase n=1 Tax=Aetokthonos hydrillicola Thurmond2011 TaxID=2712845 RepID=A0AAP5MD91_9CYAN|nr:SpoIIE family protein phosphatase [Aetokthonos hydrillicola]MBO3462647.1 SpoIIE family protein phosphatase [Aetokthonos hydrillicola CCALA 1050]MBW4585779.1 SpoIIE family protein phosphatase [Aetokthonos hydrillicola CCALA 1050]MDR9899283.1 SpoIIE family protein phosphatase [Aetokthonos hydrillicola Thurmond2011]